MFLARVVGNLWSTIKWDEVKGLKMLLVRPYHLDDLKKINPNFKDVTTSLDLKNSKISDAVVAADVLGACTGEDVIIAYGHAARTALENLTDDSSLPSFPVDAAIIAIVDKFNITDSDDN